MPKRETGARTWYARATTGNPQAGHTCGRPRGPLRITLWKAQAKCLQMARKKEGVGWEQSYWGDRDLAAVEMGEGTRSCRALAGRRHRFVWEVVW